MIRIKQVADRVACARKLMAHLAWSLCVASRDTTYVLRAIIDNSQKRC